VACARDVGTACTWLLFQLLVVQMRTYVCRTAPTMFKLVRQVEIYNCWALCTSTLFGVHLSGLLVDNSTHADLAKRTG
jgi:hypothetical protein